MPATTGTGAGGAAATAALNKWACASKRRPPAMATPNTTAGIATFFFMAASRAWVSAQGNIVAPGDSAGIVFGAPVMFGIPVMVSVAAGTVVVFGAGSVTAGTV